MKINVRDGVMGLGMVYVGDVGVRWFQMVSRLCDFRQKYVWSSGKVGHLVSGGREIETGREQVSF